MGTKDTSMRDVKLALELEPKFWSEKPKIKIEFNQQVLFEEYLEETKKFSWTLPAKDINKVSIFFLNKTERDTVGDKDKAILVKSIGIEGFHYSSFMLQSKYKPIYTNGYYRYAKENKLSVEPIINSNYLGFNGEWYLEFTWPIYQWIFETETKGMGWIYEKNI
jgi:hypothetical protein